MNQKGWWFGWWLVALVMAGGSPSRGDDRPKPSLIEGIHWPGEKGHKIDVTVAITIIDFASIKPAEEAFEMAGYLDLSWHDPTLPTNPEVLIPAQRRFRKGDIWSPELEFVNAAEQVESERAGDLYADLSGNVVQRVRFSHKFRSPLYLKRFPFDRQTLEIRVSPFDLFAHDLNLIANDKATGKLPSASVPDWRIGQVSARVVVSPNGDQSDQTFLFTVDVARRWVFYFWRVFIPLTLLAASACSVFWIDGEAVPARFGTAISALVSLVAFSYSIDFSLPKVPYLTFLDTFSLTVFAFMLAVIFAVTAIHHVDRHQGHERSEQLDRTARWAFPAGFVGLIAVQSLLSLI